VVATADPEQVRAKPGNVGAPLDGTELRFAEDGEILVRGPTRALSYVGPGAPPLAGPDGWYRTGDFGRLDGEGDLWITGRRSDRIVTGGVNVDPVEIEDVLRAHPTVVDVAVVGVPSQEWGEVVGAVVIPVWGEFTVEEVEAFEMTPHPVEFSLYYWGNDDRPGPKKYEGLLEGALSSLVIELPVSPQEAEPATPEAEEPEAEEPEAEEPERRLF